MDKKLLTNTTREFLQQAWWSGVNSCRGEDAVKNAITVNNTHADYIIAVGKAASSMCLGALLAFGEHSKNINGLIISKYNHKDARLNNYPNINYIESAHPIPDKNSLKAGQTLLEKVKSLDKNCKLLFLISGGASALVEVLNNDLTLNDLQNLNKQLILQDNAIEFINKKRGQISQIKSGKLLKNFKGNKLDILYISDVEGDDIKTIGSGIGYYAAKSDNINAHTQMIGSNKIARTAVQKFINNSEFNVISNTENLYQNTFVVAKKIADEIINGESGVYIYGGEPVIKLPPNPGVGGRNQSLALALAKHIYKRDDITILVAGTDGTDGPTNAAGGIVDGKTFAHQLLAENALKNADAGTYLAKVGDLFITQATNTNVMDLVIAIKQ